MYMKIFDEVVSILHKDYAGCLDKKGCDNPDFYRNEIKKISKQENKNDDKFVDIVQDYLLDFKDLHMGFKYNDKLKQNTFDVGFTVRRYKDSLYVLSNGKEDRVKPGYAITALDEKNVSDLVKFHKRRLMETDAERENWSSILPLYNSVQGIDEFGNSFTLELKKFEKETFQPEYSLKEITEDTLYLKLTDFTNHNAISKLINENDTLLTNRKKLIIDVRVNKGKRFSLF